MFSTFDRPVGLYYWFHGVFTDNYIVWWRCLPSIYEWDTYRISGVIAFLHVNRNDIYILSDWTMVFCSIWCFCILFFYQTYHFVMKKMVTKLSLFVVLTRGYSTIKLNEKKSKNILPEFAVFILILNPCHFTQASKCIACIRNPFSSILCFDLAFTCFCSDTGKGYTAKWNSRELFNIGKICVLENDVNIRLPSWW